MSMKHILSNISLALLIAGPLFGFSAAQAQVDPWTSVGSAGTVDEVDTAMVQFGEPPGVVMMRPASIGTLNIRYNVVAVDGVFGGDNYAVSARFRDNGASGRVIVRFKRYALNTGVTTTLLTLDSNAFAASNNFQVRSVASPCGTGLDFFNNAYFMDVEITKTAIAGTPALAILKTGLSLC